jgi:hypothetical protein
LTTCADYNNGNFISNEESNKYFKQLYKKHGLVARNEEFLIFEERNLYKDGKKLSTNQEIKLLEDHLKEKKKFEYQN